VAELQLAGDPVNEKTISRAARNTRIASALETANACSSVSNQSADRSRMPLQQRGVGAFESREAIVHGCSRLAGAQAPSCIQHYARGLQQTRSVRAPPAVCRRPLREAAACRQQ